jgi:hypothetical protein
MPDEVPGYQKTIVPPLFEILVTQKVIRDGVWQVDGKWTVRWGVVDKIPDEVTEWETSTANSLVAAVDDHLNAVAATKGYDNRITCALRSGYPNPWQAEGVAFGQWMDSCYLYLYQVDADVKNGVRPVPTANELIAELPEMVWP